MLYTGPTVNQSEGFFRPNAAIPGELGLSARNWIRFDAGAVGPAFVVEAVPKPASGALRRIFVCCICMLSHFLP